MKEVEDGEGYLMTKLPPRLTGLPMAVRVTERDGLRYDVWIKVSRMHGARGAWSDAASVAVQPVPRLVVGNLSPRDLRLVTHWIELNRAVIIGYWNGTIEIDQMLKRLQRLPSQDHKPRMERQTWAPLATSGPPARWTAMRKAMVVRLILDGKLDRVIARLRFDLAEEELSDWLWRYEEHGIKGLRTTRLQSYRMRTARQDAPAPPA